MPAQWLSCSYVTERRLAAWLKSLQLRVEYFRKWDNKEDRPKVFVLEFFFFPQTFLSAILQRYARKNKVSIDKLCFSYKFMGYGEPDSTVENGVFLGGMETEGMRYDAVKGYIDDLLPATTSAVAPYILLLPIEKHTKSLAMLSLPLYKTTSRSRGRKFGETNLVLMIDCLTKKKPEFWLTNGSAFICESLH